MRIGLVSYEYPPQQGLGGVGTYMFRLAGALGDLGHQVHVIAGPSDRPPIPQANVFLHRIPPRYDIAASNRLVRWLYWRGFARAMAWMHPAIWHWIKWNLASYDAIKAVDAQHPLDLVEVPEHAANGWMAGHIHRWPIVMRMHCPWELFVRINKFPFNPMNRVLAGLERHTVARYPDALTVPSEAMRSVAERSWTMRRPPAVIPNFMDIPAAAAPLPDESGDQFISCVGRIEPLKGQDTLARAFAAIAGKYPRAKLLIVGPDRWPGGRSFAELLPRWVPDPAVRARVLLPGMVPLDQVEAVLRSARVAVISSRGFESFSYACLEALAAARPVVTTTAGALPEMIEDGKSGLVVPPSDPAALATALDRLLGDRGLSQALALAGHARARNCYDTPRVVPQVLAAYQDASDFYCHVKVAQSERTARQWRRALDAARFWNLSQARQNATADAPPPPPAEDFAPRRVGPPLARHRSIRLRESNVA